MLWCHSLLAGFRSRALLPLLIVSWLAGSAWADEVIRSCESDFDWPPLMFQTQTPQGTADWGGFGYELVRNVLKTDKLTLKIDRAPWARCVAEAAAGHYDMLLMSSLNKDRLRDFFPSDRLFSLSIAMFHKANRSIPAKFTRVDALSRYRLCVVSGSNLTVLNLGAMKIDASAFDLDSVVAKINADRCDLSPVLVEVFRATQFKDHVDYGHDPQYEFSSVSWAPKLHYFSLFPKSLPSSGRLQQRFNLALKAYKQRGDDIKLAKKYHMLQDN